MAWTRVVTYSDVLLIRGTVI